MGNEDVAIFDLTLGDQSAEPQEVITLHRRGKLTGLFTIKFDKMDRWFEEEEQIFVHPKDPYKVVLFLPSNNTFVHSCFHSLI